MRLPNESFLSFPKIHKWDHMIREYASKKQWYEVLFNYHEMKNVGDMLVDPSLFPCILKACTKLQSWKHGISVHATVIKKGFESYTSIANSTMDFYIKCGARNSALTVFESMRNKDSVSWNVMIHGYLSQCASEEGLDLFIQARIVGFEPNVSTLVLLLQACRILGGTYDGLIIHGFIIRIGFLSVVSVQNSLLSMYVRSCNIEFAQLLFDEMGERDCISWSVMISGYAQIGEAEVAFRLFQEMCLGGIVNLDGLTMVSILQACTSAGDINLGRLVHGVVICRGFESDLFVGNSLVDMYSKCIDVDSAYKVFNQMPQRNTVSWNSILSGLVHNEHYFKALEVFHSMDKAGVEVDEVSVVNLLQLFKNLGDAVQCKCIHSVIIRRGFEMNGSVLNSLLDAYSKCELVGPAWKLFERMKKRNMISWSTIIGGFAHCAKPDEAIALFNEMMLAQEKPNTVTMLSLLEACSASAELKRSNWAHGMVIRNGMASEVVIGTALLEMYAKCGEIESSRKVFDEMPERNIVSWSAMIGAYGMNGRARDALSLLREMELRGMKPNEVTMLSVLSACSHGGLVEEGRSYFEEIIHDHEPELCSKHYSCAVDMLGRAGELEEAIEVIRKMPEGVEASASVWGALLSACRNFGNSELGRGAVSRVLELEPSSSAGYLLASSMYASGGLWGDAARMRWLVKEKGVRVLAGYSLVHVDQRAFKFLAGDKSHPQSKEIYAMVEHLHSFLKREEE
ncbi:pentatricopeptide repeat-containing protein At2g17210-like [Tasmannia lanceolata]|uniref:pentatricopeptide repeat-containing protein At2g17210-like n=1 Tax=Tasmannia lanceolata TaxID=3420 RepID=UPI0040643F26